MAFMSLATYAGVYWIPTMLNRVHGWADTKAGVTFGLLITVFSTLGVITGGRYADYLTKKGIVQAKMLSGFRGMIAAICCTVGLVITDINVGIYFIAGYCFFSSFPFGSATAAIQEIAPNKMRAIFSAFFLFVVNIIGLGFGPLIVGFLNDSIFNDPNQIHYSIFIAQVIGCSLSALCLYLGLKPFIKSVDYLKKYLAVSNQN
jgi:MFS family permease